MLIALWFLVIGVMLLLENLGISLTALWTTWRWHRGGGHGALQASAVEIFLDG